MQMGIDYKFWRIRNKVKLKRIADYIGCSTSLLSLYENDKANMEHFKKQKYDNFIREYEGK